MNDHPDTEPAPSEWEMRAAAHNRLAAELLRLNKAVLLDALAAAGVTHVVVAFDGYGDFGQIESVETRAGDNDVAMPAATIEYARAVWGQPEPERSSVSIAAAVESLAYDVLERTHRGWENDDGAYGEFIFDVAERAITLDYSERYVAVEDYQHEF